jgi:hypothetical protein
MSSLGGLLACGRDIFLRGKCIHTNELLFPFPFPLIQITKEFCNPKITKNRKRKAYIEKTF